MQAKNAFQTNIQLQNDIDPIIEVKVTDDQYFIVFDTETNGLPAK